MQETGGATGLGSVLLIFFLLSFAGLAAAPGTGRAQSWCGDECVNLDIDASLGLESLQEPTRDPNATERSRATGYATVDATGLLQIYQFQAALRAPLRFNLSDFGIRAEDWDQTEELLRTIPCARVDFMDVADHGRDNWTPVRLRETGQCTSWTPTEAVGDVFREPWDFTYWSLRLAPLNGFTLGSGSIVDGYRSTLEEDFYREGLEVEVNLNRRFAFLAGLSDILDPTVIAGRAVYRPLDSETVGSFYGAARTQLFAELGLTTAADVSAPTLLNEGGARREEAIAIGGAEARFRWSSVDDYSRDSYEIVRFEVGSRFNKFFGRDHGLHANLRFYYDIGDVDFYIDGEYRMLRGRYLPSYFNQHYRVQREQYPLSEAQREGFTRQEALFTKLDFADNLPDDTEHGYAATFRFRFWPWDAMRSAWTRDGADLWLFIEHVPSRDASGRAGAGLEFPNIADRLRLWGEFVQQGWDDVGGIFRLDSSVLNVNSRLLLTDEIYLDIYFNQAWFQFDDGTFDTTNDLGFNVGFVTTQL
jgi:hypothetical protein